jgi:excisionase family DNA binding protein
MKTQPPTPTTPYLTKAQAADYLGTSIQFIEHLIKTGKLRASKPSYKILRLHVSEIDKMMAASNTVAAPA